MPRSARLRRCALSFIIGLGLVALLHFGSSAAEQSRVYLGGTCISETAGCPPGFVPLSSTDDRNPCLQEGPVPGPSWIRISPLNPRYLECNGMPYAIASHGSLVPRWHEDGNQAQGLINQGATYARVWHQWAAWDDETGNNACGNEDKR